MQNVFIFPLLYTAAFWTKLYLGDKREETKFCGKNFHINYEFWKLVLRKLIAISEDGRLKNGSIIRAYCINNIYLKKH